MGDLVLVWGGEGSYRLGMECLFLEKLFFEDWEEEMLVKDN